MPATSPNGNGVPTASPRGVRAAEMIVAAFDELLTAFEVISPYACCLDPSSSCRKVEPGMRIPGHERDAVHRQIEFLTKEAHFDQRFPNVISRLRRTIPSIEALADEDLIDMRTETRRFEHGSLCGPSAVMVLKCVVARAGAALAKVPAETTRGARNTHGEAAALAPICRENGLHVLSAVRACAVAEIRDANSDRAASSVPAELVPTEPSSAPGREEVGGKSRRLDRNDVPSVQRLARGKLPDDFEVAAKISTLIKPFRDNPAHSPNLGKDLAAGLGISESKLKARVLSNPAAFPNAVQMWNLAVRELGRSPWRGRKPQTFPLNGDEVGPEEK